MAKCDICKNQVEETFLGKVLGTYIKIDGKQKIVCSLCQKKLKDKLKESL